MEFSDIAFSYVAERDNTGEITHSARAMTQNCVKKIGCGSALMHATPMYIFARDEKTQEIRG